MNERIKELAEQAEKYANERTSELDKNWRIFWGEIYDKKFAELIVKEVTNIVLHYTDVDEGVAVAKKHFGVEE